MIKKILNWMDDNVMITMTSIAIVLIPIYPKFPLARSEDTYVAVRLEDIFFAFYIGFFIFQILRKKVILKKIWMKLFCFFWISIFISFLCDAIFFKEITFPKIAFLNFLRRIEYMLPFFVAFNSIKTKKDFFYILNTITLTVLLISSYGILQRTFPSTFPAVVSMDKESAKGTLVYLTPGARVPSTFGGHYDFAAYLAFTLPLILSFYMYKKQKIYLVPFFLGSVGLFLTASKTSFFAYFISCAILLIFLKRYKFFSFFLVFSVFSILFSGNLRNQMDQLFFPKKIEIEKIVAGPKSNEIGDLYVASLITPIQIGYISKPVIVSGQLILTPSPQVKITGNILPTKIPKPAPVTIENNFGGESFMIRWLVEWPRAIQMFLRHPIFGGGPYSLRESVDGDYFRWLGEFGIVGTGLFLYILFTLVKTVIDYVRIEKENTKIIFLGYLFGFFALCVNAVMIDVFEASKVAFSFWIISGVIISGINIIKDKKTDKI